MIAGLLLLLAQTNDAGLFALLDRGRFDLALVELEGMSAAEAHRGETELFLRARDFEAARSAALRGLEAYPDDLFLLHRATVAALWLGKGPAAQEGARQLAQAAASSSLQQAEREAWQRDADSFAGQARELIEGAEERHRVLVRSRVVVGAILSACLALALGLMRKGY